MPTTLNNISTIANNTKTQIYQVPVGITAIALNIAICSVVPEQIAIFLSKQKADNSFITLIPGKRIDGSSPPDVYSPALDKLILLSGEKVFVQALTAKKIRATGVLFGVPCYFDPLQSPPPNEVAHISLSIAERR